MRFYSLTLWPQPQLMLKDDVAQDEGHAKSSGVYIVRSGNRSTILKQR